MPPLDGSAAAETSAIARLAQPVPKAEAAAQGGVHRRAAGAGAAPGGLVPAAGVGRRRERRTADRRDVGRGRRVAAALVAVVAGGRGDGDARVVVVGAVRRVGQVAAAVAVGDGDHAGLLRGGVHRGAEVGDRGALGLDDQDLAVRADRGHGVDVEGLLAGPAGVEARQAGAAVLVDDRQAAAGGGAGGQPEVGAVRREVGAPGWGSRRRRRSRPCGRRSWCRSACRRP